MVYFNINRVHEGKISVLNHHISYPQALRLLNEYMDQHQDRGHTLSCNKTSFVVYTKEPYYYEILKSHSDGSPRY